jgi:hypothetical protein
VVAVDRAHPAHRAQTHAAQGIGIGAHIEEPQAVEAQAQIDLAVFQAVQGRMRHQFDVDADSGRLGGDTLQNGGQQTRHRLLGQDQGEFALRRGGGKGRLTAERRLDEKQRLADRLNQGLAARREFHVAADTHQQWIVEIVPQSMQRGAHRRLRNEYFLGRPGDVFFTQQGVERDQQIEIETMELHARHWLERSVILADCAWRDIQRCAGAA